MIRVLICCIHPPTHKHRLIISNVKTTFDQNLFRKNKPENKVPSRIDDDNDDDDGNHLITTTIWKIQYFLS